MPGSRGRILIEGAVIVGSILLAFGIEAAWSARQAGLEERDNLSALLTDLDEVIGEATLRIEQDEARISEIALLSDSLRSAGPPTDAALLSLLGRMQNHRVIRARLDAYSDLVASGGITDIGDAQLRRLLARASYDLDLADRVGTEISARNAAEFVDIMHLASTDDVALVRRLALHARVTNRGRQFYVDRKREALESAVLAQEAVRTALGPS